MTFKEKVIGVVKSIPKGRVMSYGQVASFAGSPRAARQVGWILKAQELDSLPWWRVANSSGVISIKGNFSATPNLQKHLLESEGVEVSTGFVLNIDKYRYNPKFVGKQ